MENAAYTCHYLVKLKIKFQLFPHAIPDLPLGPGDMVTNDYCIGGSQSTMGSINS